MTAATITLNPGTGGDKPLVDTLATVDGGAAPVGSSAQMVKIGFGVASDFKTPSPSNPLPIANQVLTGSGSLTAQEQAVTLAIGGRYANTVFGVSGTWVGTLVFEASNDGFATFTTINALKAGEATISQTISNTASNDLYRCTTAGFLAVRLRMSAFSSGTAVITATATEQTSGVFLNFPLPAGANNIGSVFASRPDGVVAGTLTAPAQTVEIPVTGGGVGSVTLGGTWAGTVIFEGTGDDISWRPVNATQLAVTAVTLQATTVNGVYAIPCAALLKIRVNATTLTSGSAAVTLRMSGGAPNTVSISTMPLPPGAATETTLAALNGKTPALGAAAVAASSPVALPNSTSVTGGSLASPVVNTDLLTGAVNGWYDAANLRCGSIQIQTGVGISAGVITFEQTNDITASPAGNLLQVTDATAVNSNPVTSLTLVASTARAFAVPIMMRYIRARVSTAVVGGTVQAVLIGSQLPYAAVSTNVQQATSGNFNVNVGNGITNTPVTPTTTFTNSAASTNATSIKASTGTLWSVVVSNINAAARFVKFYNLATAPTVGTSVPVFTITVPTGGTVQIDGGANGLRFAAGLALAITAAAADADATVVAANDVKVATTFT